MLLHLIKSIKEICYIIDELPEHHLHLPHQINYANNKCWQKICSMQHQIINEPSWMNKATAFQTDVPIQPLHDTRKTLLNQIQLINLKLCDQRKQFDVRLDDLNFYTQWIRRLQQHYLNLNTDLAQTTIHIQIHQPDEDTKSKNCLSNPK